MPAFYIKAFNSEDTALLGGISGIYSELEKTIRVKKKNPSFSFLTVGFASFPI